MTFEKENIKNRLLIDANLNSEKFNIYNLRFDYIIKSYNSSYYDERRKFQIGIVDNILKQFDILSILEENKDVFQLTNYPNKTGDENHFFDIFAFLKGDKDISSCDNAEDFKYFNSTGIIRIALFKYFSQLDDIEGIFNLYFYYGLDFIFYTNENKEAALRLEDAIYKFFDEIIPRLNDNGMEVTFAKETLAPTKFSHTDYFGNEIKIGDKGVGCSGRGKTSGLFETQILSMTKVFINGDIRPENFIVLKSIDGRPIKGV